MKQVLTYCLILIFITGSCFNCLAQRYRKKLNIVEAKWDTVIHAPVIPDNIFSLNADGVVIPERQCKVPNFPKSALYIYWSAPSIDGEFVLMVTKKQIILTTGHENPNPDELYWFVDINEKQYEDIARNIDRSRGLFDEQNIHAFHRQLEYRKFIHERENHEGKDFNDKRYLNTKKLIDLFNKDVKPEDQILFPNEEKFLRNKPIMSAGVASEITDFIIKY
jgi:hypothetical protein